MVCDTLAVIIDVSPMVQCFRIFLSFIFLFFGFQISKGQGPVLWGFAADPVRGNETSVHITARLAPGWHLYSQFLKEGGPIPTRFKFHPDDDYVLNGVTRESGVASRFYDDTYGMEITWYSREVIFEQDILLNSTAARLTGVVEFMVCNEEMCIPGQRDFSIDVRP